MKNIEKRKEQEAEKKNKRKGEHAQREPTDKGKEEENYPNGKSQNKHEHQLIIKRKDGRCKKGDKTNSKKRKFRKQYGDQPHHKIGWPRIINKKQHSKQVCLSILIKIIILT